MDLLKCDSSGNPNSCEFIIKNFVVKDTCKYLAMENELWTSFVSHFQETLKCPIKAVSMIDKI